MVGYVVFDALVGNTDRHHQNWGVLIERHVVPGEKPRFTLQLAPTFDHASSLGRELTDERRSQYLRDGTIERYIRNGRGGIFDDPHSKHGLSPLAVAQLVAKNYPKFFQPWQARVSALLDDTVADLLGQRS